jgi:hypothetical protein
MKLLALILPFMVTLLLNARVHGQGQIGIVNLALGSGLDAPIYDIDCQTRISGPAFVAQAFIGLAPDSLRPVLPLLQIHAGRFAGYLGPQIVEVEGGGPRFFQLRVWEATAGDSYEDAIAAGGKHGVSNISLVQAIYPPGGPGIPTGLESFCLVAEPSSLALLIGGGLLMTAFRFVRP